MRKKNMEDVRRWAARRSDTALVLGGGPSVEGDFTVAMEAMDPSAAYPVLIAVKQHALAYLRHALGLDADACVFMEDPGDAGQEGLRMALLMAPETFKISPFDGWSDVEIDEPWWNGGFSSSLAVWFACAAGFERVLLAGFDCYQGHRKYWYERPGYFHPCLHYPLDAHLAAWRPALWACPNANRIRAVSGPLVEIFGRWVP